MSNTKRLTLEEVKATQEYSILTGKQQFFVEAYCSSGIDTGTYDPVEATFIAYKCKSREVARIMSYSLMQNIRIVEVLNRHFNREPLEEFLVQLNRAIQNKKLTVAQLQALKLKADIQGFTARLPGVDHQATDRIPSDIEAASAAARKAKRKKPERETKPEPKSEYDDHYHI
jgi:hypothetical protein